MAFYFHDDWIKKAKTIIPVNHAQTRQYSYAAYIAKRILEEIKPEDIKVEDSIVTICSKALARDYNHYLKDECTKVEEEIKQEIKDNFGINADVKFFISHTEEEEPDPIPPLYFGGTDTVYYYSLSIKAKL